MQEQSRDEWKEEMQYAIEIMYQNKQEEAYRWIEKHIQEIRNCLIENMQSKTGESEDCTIREEEAVTIMTHLLTAYKGYHILDMADCMRYEVCDFCGIGDRK